MKNNIISNLNLIEEWKTRTREELTRSSSNRFAVFGNWVPAFLDRMERVTFRGAQPKGPIGNAFHFHSIRF